MGPATAMAVAATLGVFLRHRTLDVAVASVPAPAVPPMLELSHWA
jgi:hypothetical protein